MTNRDEIAEFAQFADGLIKCWTRAQLYREVYVKGVAVSTQYAEAEAAQALVSFDAAFKELT